MKSVGVVDRVTFINGKRSNSTAIVRRHVAIFRPSLLETVCTCFLARVDFKSPIRCSNLISKWKCKFFLVLWRMRLMGLTTWFYSQFSVGDAFPMSMCCAVFRISRPDAMVTRWFITIDFCTFSVVRLTVRCRTIYTATIWIRKFGRSLCPRPSRKCQLVASSMHRPSLTMRCTFSVVPSTIMCAAATCSVSNSPAIRDARCTMTSVNFSANANFAMWNFWSEWMKWKYRRTLPLLPPVRQCWERKYCMFFPSQKCSSNLVWKWQFIMFDWISLQDRTRNNEPAFGEPFWYHRCAIQWPTNIGSANTRCCARGIRKGAKLYLHGSNRL